MKKRTPAQTESISHELLADDWDESYNREEGNSDHYHMTNNRCIAQQQKEEVLYALH